MGSDISLHSGLMDSFQSNWKISFFTIFTWQALLVLCSSISQFALVWHLTEQGKSATLLATGILMSILPDMVFGPFSGALVDRWNRRKVMIIADSINVIATLTLAGLFAFNHVKVWNIYGIMLLRSIGSTLHWPAMSAFTAGIVPKYYLPRVSGIRQIVQALARSVAAPVGALLINLISIHGILLINSLIAILAVISIFFVSIPDISVKDKKHSSSLFNDLCDGFKYIIGWPCLLRFMLLVAIVNFLLLPASSFVPLIITNHYRGGVFQLGFVNMLIGISSLIGGLALGIWGGFSCSFVTSLFGIFGIGVGVLVAGLAPSNLFWLFVVGNSISGFMVPFINGSSSAIIQSFVKQEFHGRVISINTFISATTTSISLLFAGLVSDIFGVRPWFIVSGIICILLGILSLTLYNAIDMEKNKSQCL